MKERSASKSAAVLEVFSLKLCASVIDHLKVAGGVCFSKHIFVKLTVVSP